MTPRSRKPVMVTMFGNSDPKSYQTNISQLLEESEDILNESNKSATQSTPSTQSTNKDMKSQSSSGSSIPIKLDGLKLLSQNSDDISSYNDNGLPVVTEASSLISSQSLSSAFKYVYFYFYLL